MTKTPEGPVVYNADKCIGCRYCMLACPFGIPRYEWEKTLPLVSKCSMCFERLKDGKVPACVEACTAENHNALIFGDLYDENSEISKELKKQDSVEIRADLGLNTGVRYRGI